jgi:hypothetical protein
MLISFLAIDRRSEADAKASHPSIPGANERIAGEVDALAAKAVSRQDKCRRAAAPLLPAF